MTKPRKIVNRIFAALIAASLIFPILILAKVAIEEINNNYVSDETITNSFGLFTLWLIVMLILLILYCCINMYLDTFDKQ